MNQPPNPTSALDFPTVKAFKTAVDKTSKPDQLTSLLTKLRNGCQKEPGIHPWANGSPEYIECWKATHAHARATGFSYQQARKTFYKSRV
ncbi:hypothetical protein A6C57_00035 [Fibrella sp. ES10-3-2-2]|nr:hypothetical protein A6C57_00035 [Fibrella sp. ES10-3-2-2]